MCYPLLLVVLAAAGGRATGPWRYRGASREHRCSETGRRRPEMTRARLVQQRLRCGTVTAAPSLHDTSLRACSRGLQRATEPWDAASGHPAVPPPSKRVAGGGLRH